MTTVAAAPVTAALPLEDVDMEAPGGLFTALPSPPEPELDSRRRLAEAGPEALSDAELLAIVLGLGRPGGEWRSLRAASDILSEPGGLRELRRSSVASLAAQPGIGEARASAIVAAIELGSRLAASPRPDQPTISSPADVHALMHPRLAHLDREHFVVLLLDTKNKVVASPTISVGTLSSSLLHPREVFKPAVKTSAASVVLVHNHPSGDVRPSAEDRTVTRRLIEAGEIFDIEVLDHVVIGDGFHSMKESGHI